MKKYIIQDAIQSGRGRTPSALMASFGYRNSPQLAAHWIEISLADSMAAGRLSLAVPGVHSICMDAAQMGKPFKDFLLIHQNKWPGDVNIVMAPKDWDFNECGNLLCEICGRHDPVMAHVWVR